MGRPRRPLDGGAEGAEAAEAHAPLPFCRRAAEHELHGGTGGHADDQPGILHVERVDEARNCSLLVSRIIVVYRPFDMSMLQS